MWIVAHFREQQASFGSRWTLPGDRVNATPHALFPHTSATRFVRRSEAHLTEQHDPGK